LVDLSGNWAETNPPVRAWPPNTNERQPFRDFAYFRVGEGVEPRWLSTSGKPIFDADGSFLGYRGSGRDITELKQREIAQRDSDERFRAITEASPVPLIIIRRSDGTILYANPIVGPAFGLAADEVVGRSIKEFYWDSSGREARLRPWRRMDTFATTK